MKSKVAQQDVSRSKALARFTEYQQTVIECPPLLFVLFVLLFVLFLFYNSSVSLVFRRCTVCSLIEGARFFAVEYFAV